MTVWPDAHLSPEIARWLTDTFDVTALPVRDLGLHGAEDDQIFFEARDHSTKPKNTQKTERGIQCGVQWLPKPLLESREWQR